MPSLCGEKTLCTVILFPGHDEMGQVGSQPRDSDWLYKMKDIKGTLGPNPVLLEPGINRFQILASSYSWISIVQAMQILKY